MRAVCLLLAAFQSCTACLQWQVINANVCKQADLAKAYLLTSLGWQLLQDISLQTAHHDSAAKQLVQLREVAGSCSVSRIHRLAIIG